MYRSTSLCRAGLCSSHSTKTPGLEPDATAGNLRDGSHREAAHRLDQRNADDTLVADGGHFDDITAAQRSDQRDHAVGREVDRVNRSARFEQHHSNVERDVRRRLQQLQSFHRGKGGEDAILALGLAVSAAYVLPARMRSADSGLQTQTNERSAADSSHHRVERTILWTCLRHSQEVWALYGMQQQ